MSWWARIAWAVGPSSEIWASRNNSGLGRINGSGLARAVGVYGRLRDLREPEVPGRANDGATTATDVYPYLQP